MTLSALSGSALGGITLGLAYVFGMVFPLFVMALLWDRYRLGERRFLQAQPVTLSLPGGRRIHTNTINIAVAVAFAVMGVFVLYLANTGTMTGGPGFQVAIGNGLAAVFGRSRSGPHRFPSRSSAPALLGLAGVFVWAPCTGAPPPQLTSTRAPRRNPGRGHRGQRRTPASCHQSEPARCPTTTPADTPAATIKELLP